MTDYTVYSRNSERTSQALSAKLKETDIIDNTAAAASRVRSFVTSTAGSGAKVVALSGKVGWTFVKVLVRGR